MFEEVQNNEEVVLDEAEEALYADDNNNSQQNPYGNINGGAAGQEQEEGNQIDTTNNIGDQQISQAKNNNYDKQIMDKFLREKSGITDDQRVLGGAQASQQQEGDEDEEEEIVDRQPAFFSVNNKKFSMSGPFAGEQDHFSMIVEHQDGASQLSDEEPFNTEHMKQLLSNEKMAPEVLPYQHALVEYICARINQQDREIAAKMQRSGASGHAITTDQRNYLNILRMELERVKYLVKAYLRARILKIEKHLLFIIEKDQAHLLSQSEMDYAWHLYEARKDHFKTELFDKISKKLNSMQDGQDIENSMITKPNTQAFVFVRFFIRKQEHHVFGYIAIEIREDCIYYLPYEEIKTFLETGQAQLV